MRVESKSITNCSLIFILRLLISLNNNLWCLSDVEVLRGSAYYRVALEKRETLILEKRRVFHMKFENFVMASFEIIVNNNHYDIY